MKKNTINPKLVLRALSHPRSGDIYIDDAPFVVGRLGEPFVTCDSLDVVTLSRLHAQISAKKGKFYLTDLRARNGTTLNGQDVNDAPVRLCNGDEVRFAAFAYRVELAEKSEKKRAATGIRLTLVSRRDDAPKDSIVITRFPFPFGKATRRIWRNSAVHPEELAYISRRHARVFVENDEVCLLDLGSRNGTFVGDQRLKGEAVPLHDGDVVAFGKQTFTYEVRIDYLSKLCAGKDRYSQKPAVSRHSNTTFVESADAFMEIFYAPQLAQREDHRTSALQVIDTDGESGKFRRFANRASVCIAQIKSLFFDSARGRSHPRIALSTGLVACGIVLGLALLTMGSVENDMKAALAERDYAGSLALASHRLRERPDDENVKALATEALLKAIVPAWQQALRDREFAAADAKLVEARLLSTHNSDGLALLKLLGWVGEVRRFVAERGGSDGRIALFEHEKDIDTLTAYWHQDAAGYRRALGRVLRLVPEFEELHDETFSRLSLLSNEKSLYLAAIDELEENVEAYLRAGRTQGLVPLINEFAARYPKIDGVQRLREDVQNYSSLQQRIDDGRPLEALRLLNDIRANTPLFEAKFAALKSEALPDASITRQFEQAASAWNDGDFDDALAVWTSLAKGRWRNPAVTRLNHAREVLEQYEELRRAKNSPHYANRLLDFRTLLVADRDDYLISAIGDDYEKHSKRSLETAQRFFRRAFVHWQTYRDSGGIQGLQRLERGVSDTYRRQATHLRNAFAHVLDAKRIYQRLNVECPDHCEPVYAEVANEIALQRRSLNELSMVLGRSVLEAKLAMIPQPQIKRVLGQPAAGRSSATSG